MPSCQVENKNCSFLFTLGRKSERQREQLWTHEGRQRCNLMCDTGQHTLCFGVCISKRKQCSNNSKKILPSKCLLILLAPFRISYFSNLSTRTLHYGTVLQKEVLLPFPLWPPQASFPFQGWCKGSSRVFAGCEAVDRGCLTFASKSLLKQLVKSSSVVRAKQKVALRIIHPHYLGSCENAAQALCENIF